MDGGETFRGARPVPGKCVDTGGADDGTQHERDDDDIVGKAEDGDEVGYEVDGREVGQQQPDSDPDPTEQGGIGRQAAQQLDHVWKQPQGIPQTDGLGAPEHKSQDQP